MVSIKYVNGNTGREHRRTFATEAAFERWQRRASREIEIISVTRDDELPPHYRDRAWLDEHCPRF